MTITLYGKIHCKKRQSYRGDLFHNQEGKCYWCGVKLRLLHLKTGRKSHITAQAMEIDHIIPRCAGGSNHFSNLVGSCKNCNIKRSMLYLKFHKQLIIIGQESPADLLRRYNSQNSTTENNYAAG